MQDDLIDNLIDELNGTIRMGSYDLHPIGAREIINKYVLTLSEIERNMIKWSRNRAAIESEINA